MWTLIVKLTTHVKNHFRLKKKNNEFTLVLFTFTIYCKGGFLQNSCDTEVKEIKKKKKEPCIQTNKNSENGYRKHNFGDNFSFLSICGRVLKVFTDHFCQSNKTKHEIKMCSKTPELCRDSTFSLIPLEVGWKHRFITATLL